MRVLVIARLTFKEAVRKKVLFGAIVLTLGFVALYGLGAYFAFRDLEHNVRMTDYMKSLASSQILMAGLYVTNFIGGLLAIFTAVGTISGEIDQGTLHAIVPKPLNRWEIVLGKWLGFALMLSVYIAATSWMVIGLIYALGGYLPPRPIESVFLIVFQALLLLSICLLGSTFLSTVANGIVILILYGIAIVGGLVEQLGSLINSQTMINIGIGTGLLIPSDTIWKLASYWLQPKLLPGFAMSGAGPFTVTYPPSIWMVLYAVFYAMAVLMASIMVFQRRDL